MGTSVGLRTKFKQHNLNPVPCFTLKYIEVKARTGFTQFIFSVRIFIDPIQVNTNSPKGRLARAGGLKVLSTRSHGDLQTILQNKMELCSYRTTDHEIF
jgi:hypothetical protein